MRFGVGDARRGRRSARARPRCAASAAFSLASAAATRRVRRRRAPGLPPIRAAALPSAASLAAFCGALAAVERVVQRQPIVALLDGVVRVLQRLDGRGEFLGGVPIGAGGARRIDRVLRLLDFFVGRIAATGDETTRASSTSGDDARPRATTSCEVYAFRSRCSTMKDLSPDDRPREKLLRHGARRSATTNWWRWCSAAARGGRTRSRVANELLRARGGLHGLARSTCRRSGARRAASARRKAAQVLAALELGRRTLTHAPAMRGFSCGRRATRRRICCRRSARGRSSSSASCCSTRKHRVLQDDGRGVGHAEHHDRRSRATCSAKRCSAAAAAVVAFHNHPSGDPTPSPDDVELTRRLAAAGVLMGIDVVDHVVLGDARYCSFKEMGRL